MEVIDAFYMSNNNTKINALYFLNMIHSKTEENDILKEAQKTIILDYHFNIRIIPLLLIKSVCMYII